MSFVLKKNFCCEMFVDIKRISKIQKRLKNSDFIKGTYRIKYPGYYVLTEDIIFDPKEENLSTEEYPIAPFGPYGLGFFAAITIECHNVILDLNDFTIKQSEIFNTKQRFFANIELGSSPFIFPQGPANFSRKQIFPENVYIKNGTLGKSSHHGIHGNNMRDIFIENITIEDFEVAGISLNNGENIYIKDCIIQNQSEQKFLSALSQSRFLLPKLKNINKMNKTLTINIENKNITGIEIEKRLEHEIQDCFDSNYNGAFSNSTKIPDGNMYGILLNTLGVAIGPFKTKREKMDKNNSIVLENITIQNIISKGLEIQGLFDLTDKKKNKYGKTQFVGPVGDVFDIKKMIDKNGNYISNILGDAQLFICKHGNEGQLGTTSIPLELVEWVEKNSDIRKKICNHLDECNGDKKYYYTEGGDSMGHTMKGSMGIFINAGEDIYMKNITIDNIVNKSEKKNALLSSCSGILLSASNDIIIENSKISNIVSDNSTSDEIKFLNDCSKIQLH